MFGKPHTGVHALCGCWYMDGQSQWGQRKLYLPLVDLSSKTTLLATTSRTQLTQSFQNTSTEKLAEVQYTFPLYDGVSVVSFKCVVAGRTIVGVVKEKQQARTDYKEAVARGETAGLLEQIPEASDAFTTKIGNIPANEKVLIEIEYLGELKHDAETDGSRFTIPTNIAPRYGSMSSETQRNLNSTPNVAGGRIQILVDIAIEEGSVIRGVQSPSHPIAITMGRTSTTTDEDTFDNHHASATLTLGSAELDKDFVIVVLAKGQDTPRALLETHPTLANHRALMATLVPKFNLPAIHPEIVFVVDRSGSMSGNMTTVITAMKVFLKSLPIGVKFNVCSFGSHFDFLFAKSKTYDKSSLDDALARISTFDANYGGTEMFSAVKGTVENRFKDMPLEIILLTDGEIWNQQELFDFINKASINESIRVFSLGIGSGASSSLVEGIARAGDGFAQFVDDNERMDKRVVKMLKGALTPHIKDYALEVKYQSTSAETDDDFEVIEKVEADLKNISLGLQKPPPPYEKKSISLFNESTKDEPTNPPVGKFDHLPAIATPSMLQAPNRIPSLYPFNRTTVYVLLGPDSCQKQVKSITLRGTSEHGPLELEIPVQDVGIGLTIHQMAAKKAVHELEQGRGWLVDAKTDGKLVKSQHEGRWDEIVEREAVRLGVQFQVGGKWCSFVAVEEHAQENVVVSQKCEKPASNVDGSVRLFGSGVSMSNAPPGGRLAPVVPCQIGGAAVARSGPTAQMGERRTSNKSESPPAPSLFQNHVAGRPFFSFGSLGSASTADRAVPSGGLFGSTSTAGFAVPSGGLFGNSSTAGGPAPINGLFGSNIPTGVGLPGNSGAVGHSSSSLFGGQTSTGSGLFGSNTPTGASLFGNSTAVSRAGGLFGGKNTAGAGLFGSHLPSETGRTEEKASIGDDATVGLFQQSPRFSRACSNSAASSDSSRPPLGLSPVAASPTAATYTLLPCSPSKMEVADNGAAGISAKSSKSAISSALSLSFLKKPALPPSSANGLASQFTGSRPKGQQGSEMKKVAYFTASSPDEAEAEGLAETPQAVSRCRKTTMSKQEQLHGLIYLQNFDGSWDLTSDLRDILKLGSTTKIYQLFAGKDQKLQKMLQATVAAIAFLELKMADEEETWEMVVQKAKAWLASTAGGDDGEIEIAKSALAERA